MFAPFIRIARVGAAVLLVVVLLSAFAILLCSEAVTIFGP
jgi:hypothetical protein